LDGWELPEKKPAKVKNAFKSYEAFVQAYDPATDKACDLDDEFSEHRQEMQNEGFKILCHQCQTAVKQHGRSGCFDHLCDEGREIVKLQHDAEQAADAIAARAPSEWLERFNNE
jgi:hypothetical protein